MVELVIKLPDNYDLSKIQNGSIASKVIFNAVANGIPLPKGHGDLIDRNDIEYLKAIHDAKFGHISWSEAIKKIKYSATTIVEADTPKRMKMADIETLIIETAHRRDLTYAKNFNGRAYALMDLDWVGYFNTLNEVLEFLDISVEIDEAESEG